MASAISVSLWSPSFLVRFLVIFCLGKVFRLLFGLCLVNFGVLPSHLGLSDSNSCFFLMTSCLFGSYSCFFHDCSWLFLRSSCFYLASSLFSQDHKDYSE